MEKVKERQFYFLYKGRGMQREFFFVGLYIYNFIVEGVWRE